MRFFHFRLFIIPMIIFMSMQLFITVIWFIQNAIGKRNRYLTTIIRFGSDLSSSQSSDFFSWGESVFLSLNQTIIILLLVLLQQGILQINIQWFTISAAFSHVPMTFFFPLMYFLRNDLRWIFFKDFVNDTCRRNTDLNSR